MSEWLLPPLDEWTAPFYDGCRAGELRVLRVIGGLGHGLDEAAVEAAEKIRFKPARRNGQPVDHTATLRVLFRLA